MLTLQSCRMTRAVLLSGAVIIAMLLGGCSPNQTPSPASGSEGATGQPTTVRFASVGGMTDAGIYLAQDRGYFAKQGIDLKYNKLANAGDLTTALASGALEVGGISLSPGLYNSLKVNLGIRIVGDKNSFQPPPFATMKFMVRTPLVKGSEADIIKSLKGHKIAIGSAKSSSYEHLFLLLEKYGLNIRDVDVKIVTYSNMAASLANGAVDAVVAMEPFRSAILKAGTAKVVSDLREVTTVGQSGVPIVYSEKFASNTKIARAFMVAYMRGVRDYNDAYLSGDKTLISAVQKIVAERSGVQLQVVQNADPAGLDPNQHVDIKQLNEIQGFFVKQGFMDKEVDTAKMVDNSFADYARSVLGEYKPPKKSE